MASSPGTCKGMFYEADKGKNCEEWSRYTWQMKDNPSIADRAEEEISRICKLQFNNDPTHPIFRREYLGEWVQDDTTLLYHYNPLKNSIDRLQLPKKHHMEYVIGMDLGWNDKNSITVIGYTPHKKDIYIVETWQKGKCLIDELAATCRYFIDKYQPRIFVSDCGGYGKGITEELRIKHKLPISSAQKTDKSAHIQAMNSDFYSGYLKVCSDLKELIVQLSTIDKDPDTGIEVKTAKCDLADSTLYAYRNALAFQARPQEKELDIESAMMLQSYESELRKQEELMFGDDYF
jgi:hypothetical protein